MKKIMFLLLIIIFFNNAKDFRVLNYNIDFYVEWDNKKDHIIKMFKEFQPDVILLQEAEENQAKELSEKLNLFWDKKAWHSDGISILSKHKILEILKIHIPNSENGAIAVKIQPNIWIVSLHLTDLEYKINDLERLREAKFILNKLNELKADKIILGGDFNSLEDSIVNELLTSNGFIDTHKNKKWARGTWIPAGDSERIDRIYVKGKFKITNGKTIDHNDVPWLKSVGWPTGDDHRLVITDLSI